MTDTIRFLIECVVFGAGWFVVVCVGGVGVVSSDGVGLDGAGVIGRTVMMTS